MDIFESWIVTTPIARYGLTTEDYPENTTAAIENAVKNNCPVMLSAQSLDDGTIICYPYKNLSALTSGNGYVQTLSFADVKDLKISNTQYVIITLEEALQIIDSKVPFMINIFNEGQIGKVEATIYDLIKNYESPVAIVSANPDTVIWFKENASNILRGIRSGKFESKTYGSYKTKKLAKLKYTTECQPDFILYNACDLPNRFVKKYNFLPIIAYNVRNEVEYLHAVRYCDNVVCTGFIPSI